MIKFANWDDETWGTKCRQWKLKNKTKIGVSPAKKLECCQWKFWEKFSILGKVKILGTEKLKVSQRKLMVSPCEFFGFFFGCHQRKLALHDCRYPQKTNPMTRQRKFCNSDTFFPRATSICFWTTPKFSLGNFTKCFHFPNFQKTSVATDRSIYIALTSSVLDVTKSYVTNQYRRRHFY